MSRVLDRHNFIEFRESPTRLERYGRSDSQASSDYKVYAVITVSFRTDPKAEWLPATAGSIIVVSRDQWELLDVVEDPLL